MAGRSYDFRNDPVLSRAGPMMAGAALDAMDEFGKELFGLWLDGTAPEHVLIEDSKWAAYMAANQRLTDQIDAELTKFAESYRDRHAPTPLPRPQRQRPDPNPRCRPDWGPINVPHQPYYCQFHAEIGSKWGAYRTGYDQLHGSDRNAKLPGSYGGDFEIEGMMQMAQIGSKLEFTFRNNQMTFNDTINPNAQYNLDVALANLARNIKASAGGPPPKDYKVHIRWREPGPWSYTIPAVQ